MVAVVAMLSAQSSSTLRLGLMINGNIEFAAHV
jgi:hypothetical protein